MIIKPDTKKVFDILQAVVGIGLIFYVGLLSLDGRWRSTRALDYYQFWVAGQAVKLMPIDGFYKPAERPLIRQFFYKKAMEGESLHEKKCIRYRKKLQFCSTPFLYSVFSWISTGDFDRDYNHYNILSFFVFVVGVFLICKRLEFPTALSGLIVFLLVMYSRVFGKVSFDGNIEQIQVGLLLLMSILHRDIMSRAQLVLAGLLMSVIVMFKPNIYLVPAGILINLLMLRKKHWVLWWGVGMIIGIVLSFGFTFMISGGTCSWLDWYHYGLPIAFQPYFLKRSLLARLFGVIFTMRHKELFIGAQSILFVWMFMVLRDWYKRGGSAQLGQYFVITMSLAVYILSGQLVEKRYFLLMTPLMILSVKTILTENWNDTASIFLPIIRSLCALTGILFINGWFGFSHDYFQNAYIGTALLFLHNIWVFSTIRPLRYQLED